MDHTQKREKTAWLPPKLSLKLPISERLGKERNKLKVATLPRRLNTRGLGGGTNSLPTQCLCTLEDPGTLGRNRKNRGYWLAGWLHRTAVCLAAGLECRAESFRQNSAPDRAEIICRFLLECLVSTHFWQALISQGRRER